MKGVLKGLRYISQIFDDEKEQEMQIGFPTDVKHVAHIGRDGPSVDSPSWMKEFNTTQDQFQPEPFQANGEPLENPDINWHSRDSSRKSSSSSRRSQNSGEPSEQTKSSRRRSLADGSSTSGSPRRDPSAKSRQSSSRTKPPSPDRSKPARHPKDTGPGPESSPKGLLPDIPKKSHRRKSKEVGSGGSTRPTRSKANHPPPAYTSPFSDPGPGPLVEEGEYKGLSEVS